jgi:SAM-dependent methyltransferase
MRGTKADEKLFWDSRARSYPRPFDPGTAAKTRRILRRVKALGADFRGREVLDIGCGTGVYALQLAAEAGRTFGVDSSAAMLKVFRLETRLRGITNSGCRLAAWSRLPRAAVAGKYDVALASMTAAIKTRVDILKMEAAARELCVYIGWAGVRKNALLEKVYAAHGLEYKAPEGAARTLAILKELGRRPKAAYLTDSWTKTASTAETLREIGVSMKVNGVRLKKAWTAALLAGLAVKGKVRQRTSMRKALIVWRPPTAASRKAR